MNEKVGKLTKSQFMALDDEQKWFLFGNAIASDNLKDKKIAELEALIKKLKEALALRIVDAYKPKTEQIESLFDEADLLACAKNCLVDDQPAKLVKEHLRKGNRNHVTSVPADTPVAVIDHTADAPETYVDENGITYVRDGVESINQIACVPAKVVVEQHVWPAYTATCETEDRTNRIVLMAGKEVRGTGCSPSMAATIALNKYDDQLPLYRQSEMFARNGLLMNRIKLASWMIRYSQMLTPLEKLFEREIYRSPFLNKDETPDLVLDVKNSKGEISRSSYMYVTIGSTYDDKERRTHALVLMKYVNGRSKDVLCEDYNKYNYNGYVMTDGYAGYNSFRNHCIC